MSIPLPPTDFNLLKGFGELITTVSAPSLDWVNYPSDGWVVLGVQTLVLPVVTGSTCLPVVVLKVYPQVPDGPL